MQTQNSQFKSEMQNTKTTETAENKTI